MSKENHAIADYATDPRLDIGVKEFLKAINSGIPPLETLPPQVVREILMQAQASVIVNTSGIDVHERTIVSDGFSIQLYIVKPQNTTEKLPAFLFLHGGGWVVGDFETHKRLVRDLVFFSGAAAVFVNYSLAPEAKYPQALNEIYATLKWLAIHGDEIGIDGERLAIVGNSAGGNMATVTSILAKERKGPEIKLQVLLWPNLDINFDTGSYREFAEQRFLTKPFVEWIYDLYTSGQEQRELIYVSPLRASVDQLRGLPQALIVTAENDILQDEGEAYSRKLREAGVESASVCYKGMIHDFGVLNALAELPATRSMVLHVAATLRRYLF
ncbi:MAG TPA: alpha/beta hydrolase [Ohtaekwangia sp.]|uniref:alpha/beta hydrolase n=1 Tax=Ohtaekwangia sp. TaxID=2066019 RepID=UPI002F950C1A